MTYDEAIKIAIKYIRKELATSEGVLKMYKSGWRRDPYWQEQDIKYATRKAEQLTRVIVALEAEPKE